MISRCNRATSLLPAAVALVVCMTAASAAAADMEIEIVSPAPGEYVTADETATIAWTDSAPDVSANITFFLSFMDDESAAGERMQIFAAAASEDSDTDTLSFDLREAVENAGEDYSYEGSGLYYVYAVMEYAGQTVESDFGGAFFLPVDSTTTPTIYMTKPDEAASCDTSFEMEWVDYHDEGNASIHLFYCTQEQAEARIDEGWSDIPGLISGFRAIALNIPEDDETDSYTWDTSNVPSHEYRLLLLITGRPLMLDENGEVITEDRTYRYWWDDQFLENPEISVTVNHGLGGNPVDDDTPRIYIDTPDNGTTFNTASVTLQGQAIDDDGVDFVWVDTNFGDITYAAADTTGYLQWHATVTLDLGENVIHASGVDTKGNESAYPPELILFYDPDFDSGSAGGTDDGGTDEQQDPLPGYDEDPVVTPTFVLNRSGEPPAYEPGSAMRVYATVPNSLLSGALAYDVYFFLVLPDGSALNYSAQYGFLPLGGATPYAAVSEGDTLSGRLILDMTLPGGIPTGRYTWMAALTPSGSSPFNSFSWVVDPAHSAASWTWSE